MELVGRWGSVSDRVIRRLWCTFWCSGRSDSLEMAKESCSLQEAWRRRNVRLYSRERMVDERERWVQQWLQ